MITNNPDIRATKARLMFIPGGPLQVFQEARKLILQGYTLLSHPLMGSLKPWQNPYRSLVLVEPAPQQKVLDARSITLIENAIAMLEARKKGGDSWPDYDPDTLAHFRRLDWELISQVAWESY